MSVLNVSAGAVNRLHDKLSLADLHDRLNHYIRHVQDLKYKVNAVDSSAFLDSIKILEDGLHTLKHSYETELGKARWGSFLFHWKRKVVNLITLSLLVAP